MSQFCDTSARSGPNPPIVEGRVVAWRPASLEDNAVHVGQQDRAANPTDGLNQAIEM